MRSNIIHLYIITFLIHFIFIFEADGYFFYIHAWNAIDSFNEENIFSKSNYILPLFLFLLYCFEVCIKCYKEMTCTRQIVKT